MWTINDVLAGCQGEIQGRLSGAIEFDGFSIDTRTLQRNNLFFALSGPNFDGHQFVGKALQKGARGAVISRNAFEVHQGQWPQLDEKQGFILVEDPLKALQALAKWHRRRFNLPLVGISGSNGKTTTKEMLAGILANKGLVLKTKGNFNNHIGLPLTLLRLNDEHQTAVVEMGINQTGEMDQLCEIAQPTIGLITNIGPAHLEGLGSLEGVAKEKCRLFEAVKTDGMAIINRDDRFLKVWEKQIPRHWTFGLQHHSETPDITAHHLVFEPEHTSFTLHQNRSGATVPVKLPVPGKHHVSNALAAAAAAASLDIPLEVISESLEAFKALPQRTEVLHIKGLTIYFDAYNANPTSVKAALDLLTSFPVKTGKRIAILGDMFELGDFSEDAHFEIGEYAARTGVDRMIAVGEYAGKVAEGALSGKINNQNISVHSDLFSLEPVLNTWAKPGDLVLIKGSRGMKMEGLLPLLGVGKPEQGGQA